MHWKRWEGAGEFRRPSDILVTPEGDIGVVRPIPGRIVLLSPMGEPVGTLPVPEAEGRGFQQILACKSSGDHVVLALEKMERRENGMSFNASLAAVRNGRVTATCATWISTTDFASPVFDEKRMGLSNVVWEVDRDGCV